MESFSSFVERSLEGSVAGLWMLKSPATRYGYSRSQRAVLGESEWGFGGSGLAYALPILKRGKLELKQPCGVHTSSSIKSSVSEGKNGSTANFCRKLWDT